MLLDPVIQFFRVKNYKFPAYNRMNLCICLTADLLFSTAKKSPIVVKLLYMTPLPQRGSPKEQRIAYFSYTVRSTA